MKYHLVATTSLRYEMITIGINCSTSYHRSICSWRSERSKILP